jgi:hypothetical protein
MSHVNGPETIDDHLGAGASDLPAEVKAKLSVFREITKYL